MKYATWVERDKAYEALRSKGLAPDCAQDIVDGLRPGHR